MQQFPGFLMTTYQRGAISAHRAEFVKNFRSQLSVFSETSKSVPLLSSDDDQLSEKNIRKLVTAIKASDFLP